MSAPAVTPQKATAVEIALQPASLDIWDKKYRLKSKDNQPVDPDPDGTWQRVAQALAQVEEPPLRDHWYQQFLWALRHGAIPAGRIVSNAGAGHHKPATSTINCTVAGTIQDSMDHILAAVHEAGLTLKAGCGIGYEFSTLRPRGAYVAGAGASTSGPLSFMDIFDAMCRTISSAGGRRGAQMATFDISHPDILDFIRAKREDGRLRQFNLSCLVTGQFMEAVKNDLDWEMVFPANRFELDDPTAEIVYRTWPTTHGYRTNPQGEVACRVVRRIKARRLWDMIMSSTYDYAEPGFILIDRVNDLNNNWFCEEIRATNPCVTADTWIHTAAGPRQVASLVGHPFLARIDGQDHPTTPQGFFKTGCKPVFRLETVAGYTLRLTGDHLVRRVDDMSRTPLAHSWQPAASLKPGDRVVLHRHAANPQWPGLHNLEEGYLMGLLVGDGTFHDQEAVLSVWLADQVVNGGTTTDGSAGVMAEALRCALTLPHRSDFQGWSFRSDCRESRLSLAAITRLARSLDICAGNKSITAAIEACSSRFYQGFLRGLFDSDGTVQGQQAKGVSVRLAQSDLPFLQAVQRMLLRLGIASQLAPRRRAARLTLLPNSHGGMDPCPTREQHELVVSNDDLRPFASLIGFADPAKTRRLTTLLTSYQHQMNREQFVARVKSVAADGMAEVYDVQIPGIHAFDANGIYVHNCGEQPLPPHGACLLGSVNLTCFVREPFTPRASFDWAMYREVVAIFTRMMDNVVEVHGLPMAPQAREIAHKRRHGMGFLGLGSTVTMLGMVYGDPSSIAFTEKVTREMALTGWEVGVQLAVEKGPAPIMTELFTLTEGMMAKRPELARDGHQLGDRLPGKVLLARYSRYMAKFPPALLDKIASLGCRFTHHTSIAPTGTISLSLGNNASNGIEPSFAHKYSRNVIREGRKTKEKVDVFSFELLAYRQLVNPRADPYGSEESQTLPDNFVDASAIAPKDHVAIQAAAQQWVDSSISKTINVPTDFPFDQFKDIYMLAYASGLKGCTTFRFNPAAFQGVLVKNEDLAATTYRFVLEDGTVLEVKGDEQIEYDGETHSAANLYDALKEGYYGKF